MRSIKADLIGTIISKKMNKALGRTIPVNSFEPEKPSEKAKWRENFIKINDVCYAKQYPNSYLDIYLPDQEFQLKKPVMVYAHGGGFLFCGKATGDAIASGTENKGNIQGIFEWFLSNGIVVVSIEYAMAPKYRFPVQIIQMNQVLEFLIEHEDEYGLDMNRVILFGSSAGADMVEIFSLMASDSSYAQKLGLDHTAISMEQIACAVIDESALIERTPEGANSIMLDQIWMGEKNLNNCANKKLAFVPKHVKDVYPPAYIVSSNVESWFYNSAFPLKEKLEQIGIENEYFYPEKTRGEYSHGFMGNFAEDYVSAECYKKMQSFVKRHIEKGNINEATGF